MWSTRLTRAAAHLLVALTLVGDDARAQDVATLSGCYAFDRPYFQWFAVRRGDPAGDTTRVLHLLATTVSSRRGLGSNVFELRPVPFATDSAVINFWARSSYWMPSDSGFITISWHNGFSGPLFRLKPVGDTLRGQVRFTTDVVGAGPPPATAWAVRSPCPQGPTATSGDPAVIAAIDATLAATDRDTTRFRRTEHALLEYSAEGGTLVGFYDGASLRKLSAYLSGHSGRLTQHLYFSGDQLAFVHSTYEQYETQSRVEHRVYLSAEQPIRRIRAQSQARPTEAVASWDPLPELLGRFKSFITCAASVAAVCTAPRFQRW